MKTAETDKSLAAMIGEQELFRNLPERYIAMLAEAAMPKKFAADDLIFREGDPANRFYLILEGEVALESEADERQPVVLQKIGANDVLGWSWLFPPYYWHFDARAMKPTKAIFFYGTWLRESCERDHGFGYEMMKRMSAVIIKRLQATRKKLAEVESRPS